MPIIFLLVVLTTLSQCYAAAAEPLVRASQWIPQDAIIALEVSDPDALLDLALDPKVIAAVTALPAYQKQAAESGFQQFVAVVKYLEIALGTDWKTGIRKLVGGGITLAVLPGDDAVVLVVDAKDGEMLKKLHDIVFTFSQSEAEKQGQPGRVRSADYRGVTSWTFDGKEAHAIVRNRFVLASKSKLLKRVIDLQAEPDAASLASLPAYRSAQQAAGTDAAAVLFANMGVIKQHPPVQKALAEGGNPMAALLFAGVTEALRGSSWLALSLRVDGDILSIDSNVDTKPSDVSDVAAFALPKKSGEGAMPLLSSSRSIAGLSLYRDLHAFYAAKDELFPERTSGLIFFENMMGIFFSGRDLTEEVLAETTPDVRFLVAQQQYDPNVGTPRVQIPAFAAVLRMQDPERFGEVAEEAWQKALGLVNFTRGQKGEPALIIDKVTHAGTTFTATHFSSTEVKDRKALDTHFNFTPSLAMSDDYLILSSTESLARDLIDAVQQDGAERVQPLAGMHSLVQVDGIQLASILQANRENLVRQNMINEGNTQAQAENEIEILLTIVQYLGEVKLDVGTQEGRPTAELQVRLNLP